MYFNTHIHTFKLEDVPVKFLPLKLVRYLAKYKRARRFVWLLNSLNPFSDKDFLSRYARFLEIGKYNSQEAIFKECQKYYPKETRFVVLPMDMAFMKAGNVPRSYINQIEELGKLALANSSVIPFFAVDPRREGVLELLKDSVKKWGTKGIKLYTPLGYFPFDKRLYPIYEFCQKNNLSVVSHCSPYNLVHFRGSKKEIEKLLKDAIYPIINAGEKKKLLCANFAYPENYRPVLKDFPNLKICLAHFGSVTYWEEFLDNPDKKGNWFNIIREMIKEYDNLYTDLSFTMNKKELFPLIKILLENNKLAERVLFGSDYYMVETKASERRFGLDFRAFIGEKHFSQIAQKNPKHFLNL